MKEQSIELDVERVGVLAPEIVREGASGRRATVLVQTDRHSYLGTLHVPDGKSRILDVLCDGRPFLVLTDVSTDRGLGAEALRNPQGTGGGLGPAPEPDAADGLEPLLVLNKGMIQCLRFVGVPSHPAGHSAFGEARRP